MCTADDLEYDAETCLLMEKPGLYFLRQHFAKTQQERIL